MKKVLLLIMSVIMLTACSSDDDGAGVKNNAPATQVFVMGQEVKANAAAPFPSWQRMLRLIISFV